MRTKVKMSGLVMHVTPDGRNYSSGRNKCERNIKRLERLIDEGWEIAGSKKEKEFELFGTFTIEVPIEILIKAGLR